MDDGGAVYVAGMGGPSPSLGNVSFLKPVTLKYDAAGTPVWATFKGGDAQVTVDAEGGACSCSTVPMTSARFEQTGSTDPVPAAPTQLSATGYFYRSENPIDLLWRTTRPPSSGTPSSAARGGLLQLRRDRAARAKTAPASATAAAGGCDLHLPRPLRRVHRRVRYSNTATASTPGDPTPATPAAVSASSDTRRTISLAWINIAMNATSITVERCAGSTCTAFVPVAQLAPTVNFWTDSGLRSRTTYRYRLYATNAAGNSPYSNIASAQAR